jgi:hypothetical protein
MEEWKIVYKNIIPKDDYQVWIQNSEEFGLIVKLGSEKYDINIFFGGGASIRMLEESMIPPNLFSLKEINIHKQGNFPNTIYEITKGSFGTLVREALVDLYDILDIKHYILITMNYVIEIITEYEPEIEVREK